MNKVLCLLLGCIVVAFCHDALAATLTVTNLNDSGPGSLRQRVMAAAPGDTINFAVSGTITLTSGQIVIGKSLTIIGPGANILAVSGNLSSRVFAIVPPSVTISGLTLMRGLDVAGGAIAVTQGATLNLSNCSLSSNVAVQAGGAIFVSGTLNATNCNFAANTAGTHGGAIMAEGASRGARLINCTVHANVAGNGGGLAIMNFLPPIMTNCTISANRAATNGGGIFLDGGASPAELANCTITGNAANSGGGLSRTSRSRVAYALRSTIVAGNTASNGPDIRSPDPVSSLGNNLIGIGGLGLTNGVRADKVGTIASPIDPKLGPLQDNGGPTLTHALLPGSPAIDMGNPTNAPATDQRGLPRIVDGDKSGSAIIDIGAFEFSNTAPLAQAQTVMGNEDMDLVITLNGSDADSHPLTAKISSLPSAGVLYQFIGPGPRGPVRGSPISNAPTPLTDPNRRVIYAPNRNGHGMPFDSFQFQVNDLVEDSAATTVTINIRPVNDRPVAQVGPNQIVNEGDIVNFDGSASFDVDLDPLTFFWNFGDGSMGVGATPTHVYADNGAYFVRLNVRDPSNAGGGNMLRVTVRNLPPFVNAGPDEEEAVGDLVSFAGRFTDAGSADTHTIAWDFGDGTGASPALLTPTHTYSHYGNYTVRLTVTDDDGGVGTDTLALTLVSALGYLEQTLAKLAPHEGAAGQIKEAIKKLGKALDREWIDEVHVSPKDGDKVFNEMKEALDHLSKLLDKDKLGPEALAAVECAVDYLVKAARLLAETLLAEVYGMVAVDPRRQDKVDKELAKAHDEFEKAEAERQAGDDVKAIEKYKKAWEHTTHAEEEATRPPK